MSTLSAQCIELRTTAVKLERMMRGEFDAISLSSIPPILRHAADTITDLCNRLEERETCHMERASWDDGTCTWGCICSECGSKYEHETGEYWHCCPNCGARIEVRS